MHRGDFGSGTQGYQNYGDATPGGGKILNILFSNNLYERHVYPKLSHW